jgi:hypothetical protein
MPGVVLVLLRTPERAKALVSAAAPTDEADSVLATRERENERVIALKSAFDEWMLERDQTQDTVLVTAVIGSAVVPTLIAQRWFMPVFKPIEQAAEPGDRTGVTADVVVQHR